MPSKKYDVGSKEYFEEYAKLSLVYLYDKKLSIIEVKDKEKPDMQSSILDLGVEVTRSIKSVNNNIGITQGIVNKYFNKGLSYNDIKEKVKETKSFKGRIFNLDGITAISPTRRFLTNTNSIIARIKFSISDKLKKLNNGSYIIFKNNWIYIFVGTSILEKKDINIILDIIRKKNKRYSKIFDLYIFDCINKLYIYDCITDKLSTKNIKKDLLTKLNNEAQIIH